MIKAGIFDVGGVIIKYDEESAFTKIAKVLKVDLVALQTAMKTYRRPLSVGDISEDTYWSKVLTQLAVTYDIESLKSLYRFEYKGYLTDNHLIDLEMLTFINKLKQNGLKLAVIANTIPQNVSVYKDLGLYANFSLLTFSYEQKLKKPNPQIFINTLNMLGVQSHEAFFVDDGERHVNAANELGIHGIRQENTTQTIQLVSQLLNN